MSTPNQPDKADPKIDKRTNNEEELEFYADGSLSSADARVPHWLKWVYVIMPLWGFLWLFLFWNGSWGWFDRGYWHELQQAANTIYPYTNVDSRPAKDKTVD